MLLVQAFYHCKSISNISVKVSEKVNIKPSSFLLVNTANSHEKLELKLNLHGKIFPPYAKFQITLIPIEITGFRSQNFTEQW